MSLRKQPPRRRLKARFSLGKPIYQIHAVRARLEAWILSQPFEVNHHDHSVRKVIRVPEPSRGTRARIALAQETGTP